MPSNVLSVAKAKINRAKSQIDDFDREIRRFFDTNGYDVVSNLNLDRTEQIWRFRLRNKDTSDLSVSAGLILHMLRTPLDNIINEIAFCHSGKRDVAFPFGKNVHAFEGRIGEKIKSLPSDAVDLIYKLQPYGGGNDLLWAIHDLNVDDKHPGLTAVGYVQGLNIGGIKVTNGRLLVMGNRWGQHLHAEGYTPKFFAIEAMSDDPEFLTTTPGAQVEYDCKPTFQIAFDKVRGLEREPAVAVLHQMRDLVESIFLTFEKRFF